MRVVTTTKYCDGHVVIADERVSEDVVTKVFNLGDGPKEIEICPWCEDNLSMRDFKHVLKEVGNAPSREEPIKGSTVRIKSTAGNRYKRKVGDLQCKFCDTIPFSSKHGCSTHEFRSHPFQRLLWEQKTNYADTAKLSRDQVERRERRLKIAEEMGLTLKEAAEKEKAAWNAGWRPGWDASAEAAKAPLSYTG